MITVCADYYPAEGVHTRNAGHACARHTTSVIASPNQSASWQTNKQLFIAVSLFSGLVATLFSLIGAWLILPVAGLEITALGGALFMVCRRQNQRHIVHFIGDHIIVEKGNGKPQQVWQLKKQKTAILVANQAHHWDPVSICLCTQQNGEQNITIGDFLNREDSQHLLAALQQQGLSVRNYSLNGDQLF
ncbi:MAG: putative membrane protein [Oceanicoccus sp.]|jgi:uncharacterized membrane protein